MTVVRTLPWLGCAALWGAAAWAWPRMPASMPVHWNVAGEVDRFGGRWEGVLLLPIVTTVALALFQLVPRIDPGGVNFAQMRGAWAGFQLAFTAFLGVIYGAMLGLWEMASVVAPALGALLLVLGALMGKIRPNYTFGVRTPWTLTSKRSWTRTHRLGGFVFAGVGGAVIVARLVSLPASFVTMFVGLAVGTVGLVIYSWRVWRDDPERVAPAGTSPE